MLKNLFLFVIALLLFSCSKEKVEKPNIVLIFIDDMGWPAISCYGNTKVETPNIDRLATEGMKFTDAYVTPQCTPSRASLLTGQHTARNKMWHVIPGYFYPYARSEESEFMEDLPRDTYILPKALKENGYKTALFGKWHLTHNYDGYYTRLFERSKDYYGFDVVDPLTNPTEYQNSEDKGVDFLTDLTIDFIEKNKDTSFFVYLSHHTIHGKVHAPQSLIQKYIDLGYPEEGVFNATYLAAIEHLDNSVGRLLNKIDELNLSENTIVLFYSDNGGVEQEFDNAPLRRGKGSAYEGGIRVPFIVRWPGKVDASTENNTPVHVVDIYPTLADIAGGKTNPLHITDGMSLKPLLTENAKLERSTLFWYLPLYDIQWGASPSAIIRKDNYKLIHFFHDYIDADHNMEYYPEGRVELYDLANDLGETTNLADSLPELAKSMQDELHDWINEMGEEIPAVNPNYNPDSVFVRYRPQKQIKDFPSNEK